MAKTYKGKYTIKKPKKYMGDATKVTYRSLWERQAFKWCEERDDVIGWSSEEVVVPYVCPTDKRAHRYFIDLKIKFSNRSSSLLLSHVPLMIVSKLTIPWSSSEIRFQS